jgi:adenylyl-sulfate kinase
MMPPGFTLWFTGLSGSGKSTLAHAVAAELEARGRRTELLDGDVVRQYLSKGLGFSKEDRDENIRRIGFVAHLVTRHGGIAITAAISPYRSVRDENRKLIGDGKFIEVFVDCPLSECEKRDIKGLYAKARARIAAGEKAGFTGLDDPYEPPLNAEIIVNTATSSIEECSATIIRKLVERGLIEAGSNLTESGRNIAPEFIPDELLQKAEAALRRAGRVHTDVLLQELHVGHSTAARLINKLAEQGKIRIN